MIIQPIQTDVHLWEAWVEFDPFSSESFGILYVMGEIKVGKAKGKKLLVKSSLQDQEGKLILSLQNEDKAHHCRMIEVIYAEAIPLMNTYSSIVICKGEDIIAEIQEIEVLV